MRGEPEGVKGAIADFVRFHCPLVASAEANPLRPKSTISENAAFHPKSNQRPCSARLAEPSPHRR